MGNKDPDLKKETNDSRDVDMLMSESLATVSSRDIEPVWRNIYTVQHSQNLFDDIVSPGREHILFSLDHATSHIDHGENIKNRVFQYGAITETIACFDSKYFATSRFSSGNFGVFYGALDDKTSIKEIMAWHLRRFGNNMEKAHEPVTIDRKMFVCALSSPHSVDLRNMIARYPQLTSSSNYEFCQSVGTAMKNAGIDFLMTQSARRPDGSCVAAFNASCIKSEKFQYFFKIIFSDGQEPQAVSSTRIDL